MRPFPTLYDTGDIQLGLSCGIIRNGHLSLLVIHTGTKSTGLFLGCVLNVKYGEYGSRRWGYRSILLKRTLHDNLIFSTL